MITHASIFSRTIAANRSAGSPEPEYQRSDRGMGRTGNGRWFASVGLQHSDSGRKENYVDGGRSGGRGCAKVQHQRLTGIYLFIFF